MTRQNDATLVPNQVLKQIKNLRANPRWLHPDRLGTVDSHTGA